MENTEKNTQKTFIKGAAILGIAGLFCKIIGAFFRIPLRNIMGVSGMTYYSTVYPYYSALLVISSAGLPTAISKLVSERISLGDYTGSKLVLKKALALLTGIGLFTTALMFFGADFLAKATNCPGSEISFRALAPALFFVSVMCAFRGYLQGLQKMTGTALSQLMEQIGKLIISLFLVKKLLPRGYDVAAMGALLGITISEVLALIIIYIFYIIDKRKNLDSYISMSVIGNDDFNSHLIRKVLSMAVPVTIGASIMPLTGIVDTLMIKNIMLSTGFTREYADMCFAVFRTDVSTVINMPAVLTVALAMSLVPAVSGACALKDRARVCRASKLGLKLALIVGLPCAVGLFVAGGNVIDFLFNVKPDELLIGTKLMQISSVGIIFLSLVQTMTGCIQGHGKPNIPVINLFIGALIKIISMYFLMKNPSINIYGAAVSTVLCYAVAGILDLVYLIRITEMKLDIYDVLIKPVISTVVMGVIVYFVLLFSGKVFSNTVSTLLSVFIGAVVYFILLFALKAFNDEELSLIPGGKIIKKLALRK